MALKKIPSPLKHKPIIVNNHNRELEKPKVAKAKPTAITKMRFANKSVAQQIADNLKCKHTVIGKTLRGVRKV